MLRRNLWLTGLIMALLAIGAVIEGWRDRRKPHEENGLIYGWLAALLAAAILVFAVVGSHYAHAHDHNHPELDDWYQSLHSNSGRLCCDGPGKDAKGLEDPDWENNSGHYRVRIDGEWIDVPDDAIVDRPNKDGRAIVWPVYKDGHPEVVCFLPGTMS